MYDFEEEELVDASRASLLRAIAEIAASSAELGFAIVPAPLGPLSTFLAGSARHLSFLWSSTATDGFAGIGSARTILTEGPQRFESLRAHIRAVSASICIAGDSAEYAPRFFGGLAFQAGTTDEVWREFGDGAFSLPRWTYRKSTSTASLALAISRADANSVEFCAGLLEEFDAIWERLARAAGRPTMMATGLADLIGAHEVAQLDLPAWQLHIEAIKSAIRSGEFKKLIAARRCDVPLPAPLDDLDVVTRLSAEDSCTRFAFRREHSSFIGATPETLIARRGQSLTTQALAGTIRSNGSEFPNSQQAKLLLGSGKDAEEHAFVVREIRRKLEQFSTAVQHPEQPVAYKVRDIIHLNTPFRATLREGVDTAELLSVLHPTPAIGGLPTETAADWITDHEVANRGWYSGPVGWIDTQDDCAFLVAIRSGVLKASSAHIFTGAGIVLESDPLAEYAETALKQRPLLRALGVEIA